jgi:hypothetical protein
MRHTTIGDDILTCNLDYLHCHRRLCDACGFPGVVPLASGFYVLLG